MDTWESIARRVKKELAKTHRLEFDYENKCARFYRAAYFTGRGKRGPLSLPPYEGKEEILITEWGAIVKRMEGLGYYGLNHAMSKALIKLEIGCLQKEFPDRTEYSWKMD
jgi:hypothetical protein